MMNPGAFAEAFAAALPALQEAVEAAGNPTAPHTDRLTSANAFAESVGELWPEAEAQGPHITELLAVLDGLVSGLPHRADGADAAGVAALEVMALLEAHLAEPADPEIIAALVELAGSDAFDPPLNPEAGALWQALLGGTAAEPVAPPMAATGAVAAAVPLIEDERPATVPKPSRTRKGAEPAEPKPSRKRKAAEIAAAEEAEQLRLAEAAEQLRRAEEEAEQLRLADEAEQSRLAEEAEQLRRAEAAAPKPSRKRKAAATAAAAAEEAARLRLAEEAAQMRLVQEAEQLRLAEEAAQVRLAQEAEQRRLAEEAEQLRLAEAAAQARLAQEAEQLRLAEEAAQARRAEEAAQLRLEEEAALLRVEEASAEFTHGAAESSRPDDAGELSDDALELLAILAAAVEDNTPDFLQRVEDIAQAQRAADRTAGAAAGREILERFAEASADVGFSAFATLCAGLGEQMEARSPKSAWPKALIADLTELPQRMLDYLADPLADAARIALVATLAHPRWPEPLTAERVNELTRALYDDPLALEVEAAPERAAEVLDEDLSLTPAEDMDAGVLGSFRREGPDLTQRLASIIQVIQGGGAIEDALRQAQRYAHTLKGSANICGVRAIAFLGHHLEDLLEFLTEHALAPSPPLGETLVMAADGLSAMFDVVNGIEPHDPEAFRPIIQDVLDWANRIDQEGAAALLWTGPAAPSGTPSTSGAAVAAPRPAAETLSAALETAPAPLWTPRSPTGQTLSAALEHPARAGGAASEADEAYLQVPARAVDDLLRLVGEMSLALSQSEEQLRQASRTLRESEEIDNRNLIQVAELEKLVDLRGLGGRVPGGAPGADRAFDPLELDQYDEMYIAARRVNEGVNDVRDLTRSLDATVAAMTELTSQQIKLSQELRQLTMGTRLVSVQSVMARLQRAVRQTARATGKEAELHIQGTEVRIDGDVLDRLMPALMHVVRNSIDHGIEPAETRLALGKPAQGELVLGFRQSGDQIEVTFADDGAGLDLERIRAKAITAGLLDPHATPTDQELILMTLRPGFSTRERATQVSGRGVGMDVVANTIRLLNGSLTIESTAGAGYRLCARFPSSLLTIQCILIRCDDQPLAMPANEVRFAVLAAEGEVHPTDGGWEFQHGAETYPLAHFNTLLGRPARAPDSGGGVVLVVNAEGIERAVLVDELIDCRELVVKKLAALVPPLPGLLAASILGDGRVVPIVELQTLMRIAATADLAVVAAEAAPETLALPTILVVDDSLSMRRILAQLVTDAGYRALTARDGMAAIQTIIREPVDLMLVDMEMPQMNGLELTAHLRARAETSTLPIGMITSRSTERHRREALNVGVTHYFVKPYQDEEVLDFIHQSLASVA